jgi:rare lipoprotein A
MAAERTLRSYLWSIGLILALLLTEGSGGLAAPQPRAALRRASQRGTPRVTQVGKASWYGSHHQGRKTASGERFYQHELTAAHRTLPLGTTAKVTNLETGQAVQVTINDRGPHAKGRIIDLSRGAAQRIGLKKDGTTRVSVEATPRVQESQTAWAPGGQSKKARKKPA